MQRKLEIVGQMRNLKWLGSIFKILDKYLNSYVEAYKVTKSGSLSLSLLFLPHQTLPTATLSTIAMVVGEPSSLSFPSFPLVSFLPRFSLSL